MKKTSLAIIAFVALLLLGRMASAQEWKFLFSLQADKNGVALSHPASLFIDAPAERYYVVDTGHNRLISFSRDGQLLQAFNAGGALDKPIAMIKKGDGRLLLLEKGKGALTEIDLKSRAVQPHRLEDQGRMLYPQRLQAGAQGLYLLDKVSGGIVLLDAALAVTARLSCPDCRSGYADFALKGSTVYALPILGTAVHTFDGAGKLTGQIALTPPPEFPVALALDPAGGFLVLERHANQVAQYQADGRLLRRHLGPGHKEGALSYPTEIQVDPWGRVCIVDEGNGRVSVYQP
jgi:hypothetical protein